MPAPGPGHVEPGGAPLIQPLSAEVTMIKLSVGPMDNNAYVLQTRSGASLLIDAANDADRLATVVDATPEMIITTHRHPDHWQALGDLVDRWQPKLYAGTPDVKAIEEGSGVSGVQGVWDGDQLKLGEAYVEIIGLVGHTPGSVAVIYRGDVTHLFTGDGLFPGGVGKTGSEADFRSLLTGVENKIFNIYDDDTVVHPGHGDDTTLGQQRPLLQEWRTRGW
jgi:glyoxylase-like metal-dependent hydrolase (beta-lactamase superfamily II)